jgi:hypothetical protein
VSQCPKSLRFGRWLTLYCQDEEGHEGEHVAPPMTWASLRQLGGKERDETRRRKKWEAVARRVLGSPSTRRERRG